MYRLIRATSSDYRTYRRSFERLEYSFFEREEENPFLTKKIMQKAYAAEPIYGRGKYLDLIESNNFEIYFFEKDGEVIGFIELIFSEAVCTINNFSVFEHGKGLGTLLFQETLNIIRSHQSQKITLWCPYNGAQIFWKKMGFRKKAKYRPIPPALKNIAISKEAIQAIQQSFNASFEMRL